MEIFISIIAGLLMFVGVLALFIGITGLFRMPDFFARIHAASVIDTLGAGSITLGLILYSGFNITTLKLLLILLFFFLTTPTACYALARSAADQKKSLLATMQDDQ